MIPLEILSWENRQSVGGGGGEEFSTHDNFKRTGCILGCENWYR